MEKLLELYKQILDYAGMSADEEGLISYGSYISPEPATLNNARLVLPLRHFLKDPDPTKRIIFSPLRENIVEGESKVIQRLRHILNVRINYTFGVVAQSILMMAASPELQKKLSSDQVKTLLPLKDVDKKTLTTFTTLMTAAIKRPDVPTPAERVFVYCYLRKGGTIDNRRYSRVGFIRFPMLADLKKADKELYGVKMRAKDVEIFRALMEVILGKDPEEKFHYGSDSKIAPCLDALMQSTMNVASRLNDFLDSEFGETIEDADKLIFNGEWVEAFENLEPYRALIKLVPMQAGSEEAPKETTAQAPQQYATPAPAPASAIPTPTPVPPQKNRQGTVSFKDLMAAANQNRQMPQQFAQPLPQYQPAPQLQPQNQAAYANPFTGAVQQQFYQNTVMRDPNYGRPGMRGNANTTYPTGAPVMGSYNGIAPI